MDAPGSGSPTPDLLRHLPLAEAVEQLEEALVEAGQRLRDQATPQVINAGKGLWILRNAERAEASYEAELLLTGRRVKAYTCSCAAFAKTYVCEHLAALLAVVQLSKLPKSRPTQPRSKATVTTKALLRGVEHADLVEFVLDRARGDSDLALDLRVRFAHLTNVADRYAGVVERLLSRQGKRYSAKELRRLQLALDHFAGLRVGWLAQGHWLDLFELDTTLAEKLVVVADKLIDTRVDAVAYIKGLLDELAAVVGARPAPVILERIGAWLDDQRERGAYYRLDLDAGFYPLAAALGATAKQTAAEIEGAIERFGESPARLRTYLTALRASDQNDAARALLLRHLDQPRMVFEALEADVATGHLERAARLAEEALPHTTEADLRTRLLRFVIALATPLHNVALVEAHAEALLLATGQVDEVVTAMAPLSDAGRATLVARLLQAVQRAQGRARPPSLPRPATELRPSQLAEIEADLTLRLEDGPALEALLYRSDDERVVMKYLPALLPLIPADDVALLLETKIREHLDTHLGHVPAVYVTELLDAVARRDRTQLVPVLVERLRATYSERAALLDAFKAAAF